MQYTSFRNRLFPLVIGGMVTLTIIKILSTVFLTPLMGYANNYDFIRQSSCIGVWQSYPDQPNKPMTANNPKAPVNALIFNGKKDSNHCLKSIDNIFPWITTNYHSIGDKIDYREISFWKILLLLLGFGVLLFTVPGKCNLFAISLSFFFIFSDTAILLYVNTLYCDFSVIISCFFTTLTASLLVIKISKKLPIIAVLIISIIWLGFSKYQYMPLAVFSGITCSFLIIFVQRNMKYGIALFMISLSIPILFTQINANAPMIKAINYANATDTFLYAVLPEATDKIAALQILGLPEKCMEGIGKNWYTPGFAKNHPCPKVKDLRRIQLLKLFISDPSTFIEPMRKASIRMVPFCPDYLGHIEKTPDKSPGRYAIVQKSSLSYAMGKVLKNIMPPFVLVDIIISLIATLIVFSIKSLDYHSKFFIALIGFGGIVVFYSIFSSVFGDGYCEIQKHSVCFLVGISLQLTGIISLLLCNLKNAPNILKRHHNQTPDESPLFTT